MDKIIFHPDAKKELYDGIDYYKNINYNLGVAFLREVEFALENISFFPLAWVKIEYNIRRSLLNKFPYAVLYSVKNDTIFIVAIMNLRQKPNYWRDRL